MVSPAEAAPQNDSVVLPHIQQRRTQAQEPTAPLILCQTRNPLPLEEAKINIVGVGISQASTSSVSSVSPQS